MFKIRLVKPEETLSVRQRVLWPDLPLSDLRLTEDDIGLHFGAFYSVSGDDSGTIVGVASFFVDATSARLRKMAILPEMQGRGCGTGIIDSAVDHFKSNGITLIWCDVRASAVGFYNRLGFEIEGDTFLKDGILYMKAQKSLI